MRRVDREIEYIPTQFICEFIRYNCEADGIQFKSSLHKNGINLIVFDPENLICEDVETKEVNNIIIESE